MNVIVIFAHPDEGEIYAGGTSYLFSRLGHRVKFLSLTNGDAGHYAMAPEELAAKRYQEAMNAKAILDLAEYEILDHHDQYLENTASIRQVVANRIQQWKADIVFSYYSIEGGHIDNMCAGRIVRDAAPLIEMPRIPHELGILDDVQSNPEQQRKLIFDNTYAFTQKTPPIELALQKWFGPSHSTTVKYVEAFEIAEFGRQITDQEALQMFPMLNRSPGT